MCRGLHIDSLADSFRVVALGGERKEEFEGWTRMVLCPKECDCLSNEDRVDLIVFPVAVAEE